MGDGTHHVVIVGGGFGGLSAARALRREAVRVTLVNRRNFHLFQPLLYQVATGGLSPANIAAPLRSVLSKQRNATVLRAEVKGFELGKKRVQLDRGHVDYDSLVVATGMRNHYFGNDWEALAPGLKSIEDATEIRRRLLGCYEDAERTDDSTERARLLTHVVVGAGPTGVEMAGAMAELARYTLKGDFRRVETPRTRVVLVEGGARVLPSFPGSLSGEALRSLERLGVEVRCETLVKNICSTEVTLNSGGTVETLPVGIVVWAAGVKATPVGRWLAKASGVEADRMGRVPVAEDLSLPGHPEVTVIGDLALSIDPQTQRPLPGVSPVAMQQGRYAARRIVNLMRDRSVKPFRYFNRGSMATIGRAAAVADLGWCRFSGYFAWLAWLFIHLMYIVQFGNRVLISVQWSWNYFTRNRAARIITRKRWPDEDASGSS